MLLALAGVRPAHTGSEDRTLTSEQQRPAVLLNLSLGGSGDRQIPVIGGQVRLVGKPVRLAGDVIRQIAEPDSGE